MLVIVKEILTSEFRSSRSHDATANATSVEAVRTRGLLFWPVTIKHLPWTLKPRTSLSLEREGSTECSDCGAGFYSGPDSGLHRK